MSRGVLESEHISVQRLAREIRGGREGVLFCGRLGTRCLPRAAILRIADQRMAQMGQMDADLMLAAVFEAAFDEACERPLGIAESLDDAIARARLFTLSAQDRHAFAIERAAPDVAFDKPVARTRGAPYDGVIGAFDGVGGELFGEALHRLLVLGGNEKPARVLVEAVDDARPRLAADAGKVRSAMGDEGVYQRAVGIAGGRMDDKA